MSKYSFSRIFSKIYYILVLAVILDAFPFCLNACGESEDTGATPSQINAQSGSELSTAKSKTTAPTAEASAKQNKAESSISENSTPNKQSSGGNSDNKAENNAENENIANQNGSENTSEKNNDSEADPQADNNEKSDVKNINKASSSQKNDNNYSSNNEADPGDDIRAIQNESSQSSKPNAGNQAKAESDYTKDIDNAEVNINDLFL